MTDLQRRLLQVVQDDFPLVPRPYQVLAERVGAGEREVIEALKDLCARGVIRELSPVFDYARLGYVATLATMSVPEERLEEVAAVINEYPEVTHNYQRRHRYNVWFALVAESQERLARVLGEIQRRCRCGPVYSLPAQRVFKINVSFDFADEGRER